jgi:hypothetical protein
MKINRYSYRTSSRVKLKRNITILQGIYNFLFPFFYFDKVETGYKGRFHAGCAPTPVFTCTTTQPKNRNWKLPIFINPFVSGSNNGPACICIAKQYTGPVPVKTFFAACYNAVFS